MNSHSEQKYVIELPESSKRHNSKKMISAFAFACAMLLTILIPNFHIGVLYNLWSQYTRNVSRNSCTCSCWDTAFKGIYESGIASYKHVYFNATVNSAKIWTIIVIGACMLTDCIRKMIKLGCKNRLRFRFAVMFLVNIYPNYYSWWVYFNYWNDEFYSQWYHQLLFTITELVSTVLVVHLMDQRTKIQMWHLVIILDIAIAHALCALIDQFSYNVLKGGGALHQVLRDVCFMIPDVLFIYVPGKELQVIARQTDIPSLLTNKLFIASVAFISLMWVVNSYL